MPNGEDPDTFEYNLNATSIHIYFDKWIETETYCLSTRKKHEETKKAEGVFFL